MPIKHKGYYAHVSDETSRAVSRKWGSIVRLIFNPQWVSAGEPVRIPKRE
jgi:hypothetical protein